MGSKPTLNVARANTTRNWSKTQRDRPQEVRHPMTVAGGAPPNACYAELPRVPFPMVVAAVAEEVDSDEESWDSEDGASSSGARSIDVTFRPGGKVRFTGTWLGQLAQDTDQKYKPGEWRDKSCFLPTLVGGADNAAVVKHFRVAVQAGNCGQVRLLLQSGIPPDVVLKDDRRRTGLHIAAERGDASMCQLLLGYSADPHLQDLSKWSPLDIARECDHTPLFHMLKGDTYNKLHGLGLYGRADARHVLMDRGIGSLPGSREAGRSPPSTPSSSSRSHRPARAAKSAASDVAGLGERAGPELPLQALHPGFMAPPLHVPADAVCGRRGSRRGSRRSRVGPRTS